MSARCAILACPAVPRREAWCRRLLAAAPRHLAVLNLAAEKAGWGAPLAAGRGRGIALFECFQTIVAHVAEGMWYELSTLKRYLDISLALLRERGRDGYAGVNPVIDDQAEVHESVLWDNVTVEKGAYVWRAILGDGVRVLAGERIEDAVMVRAELVSGKTPPAKALKGYFKGNNFVVSLSQ